MPEIHKPADAATPILDPIRRRWSPRAFSDRPVSDDDLATVLDAARWAASSFNEQPWRYIVARKGDGDAFAKALACLAEKNRQWAQSAPVLMFSIGKTHFSANGKPNRVWLHDVGAASAQLTIQAMALGLYVHQMAGIDQAAVRATYGIPDGFEPVAGLALGYQGELDAIPEDFHKSEQAPRTRMARDAVVFKGEWGEGAGI